MPDRPTSNFSRDLGAALYGYMKQRDISQKRLAVRIDRATGYVSEHLSGKRPVDTDMIDAVAELAGVDTNDLLKEVHRRMTEQPPPLPARDTADRIVDQARATASDAKKAARPTRRKAKEA